MTPQSNPSAQLSLMPLNKSWCKWSVEPEVRWSFLLSVLHFRMHSKVWVLMKRFLQGFLCSSPSKPQGRGRVSNSLTGESESISITTKVQPELFGTFLCAGGGLKTERAPGKRDLLGSPLEQEHSSALLTGVTALCCRTYEWNICALTFTNTKAPDVAMCNF